MGIPAYFAWIIKNHKHIIQKLHTIKINKHIDNLYIDSNSIIYDSLDFTMYANKHQFEEYILTKVVDKLHSIINTVNPGKNINI